ncbi:HWE histidine kinase domain-containing protein [Acetobacter conturbans]|uniref:histidine kinase n=1 Tax=Acetobacter conturbans TaxID=1737472 RepID=A0ABX0JZY4_9PROT|nr:HWE histidine kinase domain-containing protein [Acetobacter conturbans]NHN88560.1 GAF domain-containing protein [Acetobacter conturbans]
MNMEFENVLFGQADLLSCDREPIHIPQSIQPAGCVLVFSPQECRLTRYSANTQAYLSLPEIRFGLSLNECFGEAITAEILASAAQSASGKPSILFDLELMTGFRRDIVVHYSGDELIVECEDAMPSALHTSVLANQRRIVETIRNPADILGLLRATAPVMRQAFGYDRVMIYRFSPDWSGKVIVEDRREGLESFLGQHFPSGDIPSQARELYKRSLIRVITDATFAPVPLVQQDGLLPLDMTFMHLRAVSPIHCEYLTNMGVRASMSLSLVVDGELWGLIAFHHYEVKKPAMAERVMAKMVGEMLALQLVALIRSRRLHLTQNTHLFLSHFLRKATEENGPSYIQERVQELLTVIECDGGGVWMEGHWTPKGQTLNEAAVVDLLSVVKKNGNDDMWCSDHLLKDCPVLAGRMSGIAGALVVPMWPQGNDYLVIFRQEVIQTVLWGGDPKKTYSTGPHGVRLTPRRSFDLWKEEVRNHCLEWTPEDLELAGQIRSTLMEIMAVTHQRILRERTRSEELQRILNDELNHRVKNILAIVQTLVAREPTACDSAVEYSRSLQGRISSLATAHDVALVAKAETTLKDLLQAELAPYETSANSIVLEGPSFILSRRALTFLALLFHELATNAAKYGALSTSHGCLTVKWAYESQSASWNILWEEKGGPEVVVPKQAGFGSLLLDRAVTHNLGGKAVRHFLPEGIRLEITLPEQPAGATFSEFSDAGSRKGITAIGMEAEKTLAGKTVLLLEDEFLIALDVEQALSEKKAAHVYTASSIAQACEILERYLVDVAILDIDIGGETSAPVARLLADRGVPFVFTTGYDNDPEINQSFPEAEIIKKPYEIKDILKALAISSGCGN